MTLRLHVIHDGHGWRAFDADGGSVVLDGVEGRFLPVLPEQAEVTLLVLPIELLLVRTFTLPLAHPRFIDTEILGQELDERAGIESDAWWLVWQAGKTDDAVAGLVIGMPEAWREEIDADPQWRQVQAVLVDAETHLARFLPSATTEDTLAILDVDAEGVFLGVCRQGIWQGMRRLKRTADMDAMAEDCRRSLQAMGWPDDGVALGRVDRDLSGALGLAQWRGEVLHDALPPRVTHDLAAEHCKLDFRHDRWAVRDASGLRQWLRPLVLAAGMLIIWVAMAAYQLHQLSARADAYREQIVQAFHRGLPDEPVMIDALAQLRKAAGSSAGSSEFAAWLQQLAAINRAYKAMPWQMQELEWRDGVVKMAGKADSLEKLNRLRALLEKESGHRVELADTDLSGKTVHFRMRWQ